ncbi:hypothetical protein GNI_081660 [Gregarina niphandrodes]|uniref:Inner membrane complex protein n=1 Tax=Gregarina niphandrodes TaxID=110365 RepID=A0A023B684_GRENI|nr:hypothetical protein GNI_081660 [Gregarina niphandrodes]EZG65909.1 hypothetical protein GNI_081660 [Gregarina niphandrodes]|eukprot:XP_011134032.1 hypothetical protein GNI_081660 [Gregarina niphandrodes]
MDRKSEPASSGIHSTAAKSAPFEPGHEHVDLVQAPVHDEFKLPPREDSREVVEMDPNDQIHRSIIPHLHVKEVFQEVEHEVHKKRYVKEPRVQVLHRKLAIEKEVKRHEKVEVPQLCVVDKITEKYVDLEKERVIQKPQYVIQERLVPLPRRKFEETTVRIPKEDYEQMVNQNLDNLAFPGNASNLRPDEGYFDYQTGQWSAHPGMPDLIPDEFKDISGLITSDSPGFLNMDHPEGVPANVRYVPQPVEIPVVHYRPVPVERLVDRNVPVPVELRVTQEFNVPSLFPVWNESPVPIHVNRFIEKPVPADCFVNRAMLSAYMAATKNIDRAATDQAAKGPGMFDGCCNKPQNPIRVKMSDAERMAANLTEDDVDHLKSFNSRGFSIGGPGFNRSESRAFLANQFTIRPDEERPDEERPGQ